MAGAYIGDGIKWAYQMSVESSMDDNMTIKETVSLLMESIPYEKST